MGSCFTNKVSIHYLPATCSSLRSSLQIQLNIPGKSAAAYDRMLHRRSQLNAPASSLPRPSSSLPEFLLQGWCFRPPLYSCVSTSISPVWWFCLFPSVPFISMSLSLLYCPSLGSYPPSPGLIKMTQIDLLACSLFPCYPHHLSLDSPASWLPGNTPPCLGVSSGSLFPTPTPSSPISLSEPFRALSM